MLPSSRSPLGAMTFLRNVIPPYVFDLSMILSENRAHFSAIMLQMRP
jgi:hypothetical protein